MIAGFNWHLYLTSLIIWLKRRYVLLKYFLLHWMIFCLIMFVRLFDWKSLNVNIYHSIIFHICTTTIQKYCLFWINNFTHILVSFKISNVWIEQMSSRKVLSLVTELSIWSIKRLPRETFLEPIFEIVCQTDPLRSLTFFQSASKSLINKSNFTDFLFILHYNDKILLCIVFNSVIVKQ